MSLINGVCFACSLLGKRYVGRDLGTNPEGKEVNEGKGSAEGKERIG